MYFFLGFYSRSQWVWVVLKIFDNVKYILISIKYIKYIYLNGKR